MKLMIADDEEYSREGIRDLIEWKQYGIREVMLARDGNEALTIAKWFTPDIIITDIKMPRRDGIDFAKEIIRILPCCKIIFISGYVEVDYFKSALQLNVIDYIVKPLNKEQLKDAVEKAVEGIKQQQHLNEIRVDNLEMKKVKLLQILLCAQSDEEWVKKLCQEIDFPMKGSFICMVIRKNGYNGRRAEVLHWINQIMAKYKNSYLLDYVENTGYVVVVHNKNKGLLKERIHEILREEGIALGIGIAVGSIFSVNQSYISAIRAIEQHFFESEKRLYELTEEMMIPKNLDYSLYNQFTALLNEDSSELRPWFQNIICEINHSKRYRKNNIIAMFTSFLTYILNERKGIITYLQGINSPKDIETYIQRVESFKQIEELVEMVLDAMEAEKNNKNGYSWTVQNILKYIDENYSNSELSVQEIADYVHLSTTYLSIVFKKEVKVTLKHYLSNYRLEKAKKMLRNENYKITDVAEQCGYANANYFARVFKESEDMTPVEYREKVIK